MDLSEAFGAAMREVRKERKLSQEAAAQACGIDRRYFARLEHGKKNPTLRMIEKLASGLAVRPSELMDRAERLTNRKS